MKFIADLHIHSKFSRATSKNLDLENIYIAAQIKGITVVGTGDAIHPGWFSELKEKLIPAEEGLYKLRKDIADVCDREVPILCRSKVRFVLQTEISNIYKKNGVTRKNHNLIYFPNMEAAEKFQSRIEAIGNIRSDGRPILGLDAKHLLEIALEVNPDTYLIPAHIWTPWFSMLGSKSGFDSLEECFEDMSPYIFAVETGLSSDPKMNRMVSDLDDLTLVSNSDAHSPANLGREVNLFDTNLSYHDIRSALEKKEGNGFNGTIEFYPEEGKYHLDGHRKCRFRCHPQESRSLNKICPACGKPLTLGVLNRVMDLADRKNEEKNSGPRDKFCHRVPLVNLISEILKTGPQSKKVQRAYLSLITKFGNEISILNDIPVGDLERSSVSLLSHAIDRMRTGDIRLLPGYDGEYGNISIFSDGERNRLLGQLSMFETNQTDKEAYNPCGKQKQKYRKMKSLSAVKLNEENEGVKEKKSAPGGGSLSTPALISLNKAQKTAVMHPFGPLLIVAGPGTGKTMTLTHRIAFLIDQKNVLPENILAITFTNKAAREMNDRLGKLLGKKAELPFTATFHQFCLRLLKEKEEYKDFGIVEEKGRRQLISHVIKRIKNEGGKSKPDREATMKNIAAAKQKMMGPEAFFNEDESEEKIVSKIYSVYEYSLKIQKLLDFEDLIFKVVVEMESNETFRKQCQNRFQYVFVDEYQDINHAQYRLIRALSPQNKNICVIGDPDQSIYGFRGSDYRYFINFMNDYPDSKMVFLDRNYRSTRVILKSAFEVMEGHQLSLPNQENQKREVRSCKEGQHRNVHVFEMSNEKAEAEAVARTIEKMVGGAGYHAVDAGRVGYVDVSDPLSFSDIAVLYRTGDQHRIIAENLSRYGIPFQVAGRADKGGFNEMGPLLSLVKVMEGFGHYGDLLDVLEEWQSGIGKETVFDFCQWGLQHGYNLWNAMNEVKRFPIPGMSRLRQEKLVDFVKIINGFAQETEEMSFSNQLRYLVTHTRLKRLINENKERASIFDGMVASIEENAMTADAFFNGKALEADVDTISFNVEKVTLMTFHAAKGLEFPIVFIIGCEDGLIPLHRSEKKVDNDDEERRLLFVAMTRAKELLFLTWARRRRRFGKKITRQLSSYVSDISDDLLVIQEPVYGKKRQQVQTQMKLF